MLLTSLAFVTSRANFFFAATSLSQNWGILWSVKRQTPIRKMLQKNHFYDFFVLELKRLYLPILLDVEGIFGIQLFFISDPLSDFDPRNSILCPKILIGFKMRHYFLN